ncbi:MAG TPA: divalent-cation tolerance protein CutA [Elusimicrobiota bacterium]|nr:divalent-cation tolerance protein CutA [Elusimicrobiota bacterium]
MSAYIVFVTAPDSKEASRLSRALVEGKLAACVNIVPGISSRYWWKGKIETAREALLVIKTSSTKYMALERRIRQLHSYSVPEILALPVDRGSRPYLRWIAESLAR